MIVIKDTFSFPEFNPRHLFINSRTHMASLLDGGRNDNATSTTLRMLRKTSATIKSKQYQVRLG